MMGTNAITVILCFYATMLIAVGIVLGYLIFN